MTNEDIKSYAKQLKPCPFCGGKAAVGKFAVQGYFVAGCSNSVRCGVSPITFPRETPEEAMEIWNNRKDEDDTHNQT